METCLDTELFQSPRSGKFESNSKPLQTKMLTKNTFQSPRSGKFESNQQGNGDSVRAMCKSFNPLDRGNLNQIKAPEWLAKAANKIRFQSPRSGKFESNKSFKKKD